MLSNIFSGSDFEFAQIYCMPGMPRNSLCKRYYQFTLHAALANLLHKTPAGTAVSYHDFPDAEPEQSKNKQENGGFFAFLKRLNFQTFYILRDILMLSSNWRDEQFKTFLTEFNPDLIFAPLYSSHFMFALNRYVFDTLQKPVVSFVSDDVYTLRQMRISPIYWVDRLIQRSKIQKLIRFYSCIYTMTSEQAEQMKQDFHCDMRILRKCADQSPRTIAHDGQQPIRFLYAGGIYLAREQTLAEVARALKENASGTARLDIYTNSRLSIRMQRVLNDGETTFLHTAVPFDDLMRRYGESDVALHVESFRRKYALQTRLSFSTKIVDCLAGGCAVLAIGPAVNAGIRYLHNENAAICVRDKRMIRSTVQQLISHPELVRIYSEKAVDCARRNHDPKTVREGLKRDLETILEQYSKD